MAATGQGRASARVNVSGRGETNIATGVPVLDHLLSALAVSASFDLALEVAPGSPEAEIGIAGRSLGEALGKARSDADALATAAGGSLGRLLDVTTVGGLGWASGVRLAAVTATGTANRAPVFTPRDVVVQVSVQARWEFVPGPR